MAAFDVSHFADALRTLSLDPGHRHNLGRAGPPRVGGLCWDDLATDQGRIYRDVMGWEVAEEFDVGEFLDDFAAVVTERGLA